MQTAKGGYVYILMNKVNTVNYTGVTNSLLKRIPEHKFKKDPYSFTSRYNINKLVFYEFFETIEEAIEREKFIKGKNRAWKISLIKSLNPYFKDLFLKHTELGLE